MHQRLFQLLIAATLCASVAAQPPNILFILADDQRHDEFACAGEPFLQTPTLDRLAEQGVRFENMTVTTSIRMVSRATIFTGLMQRSHGFAPGNAKSRPVSLGDEKLCFPNLLRQVGYRTGYFGKNHVSFKSGTKKAFSRMFDEWAHIHRHPFFKKMPDGSQRHCDEIIGDRSVVFVQSQAEDQPFFLYMSFNIAHAEDRGSASWDWSFSMAEDRGRMYEDISPPQPYLNEPAVFDALPEFLEKHQRIDRAFIGAGIRQKNMM